MKIFANFFLCFLFLSQTTLAEQSKKIGYPKPINKYVNDFANIIDSADTQKIKQSLKQVDKQTKTEITVVTINSINDYQETEKNFEKFATALFNTWGIGKKEKNDGILFLIAIKDRKVRIELGSGYQDVYNRLAKSVIDNDITPYFKNNQYSRGIYEGTHGIIKSVTKEASWIEFYRWHLLTALIIFILTGAAISCLRTGKKGWGWLLFAAAGLLFIFLIKMIFNKSSGGGKFGGGSSSGGGASGEW